METRFEDMPRSIDARRITETEGAECTKSTEMYMWWQEKFHCLYAQAIHYPDIVAAAYVYPELGSTHDEMRKSLERFMYNSIATRNEETAHVAPVMPPEAIPLTSVILEEQSVAA